VKEVSIGVEGGCVARHTDDEQGGEGTGIGHREAVLGEVDAEGAGGEGDIDAIVDDHGRCALRRANQLQERAAVEVLLANLDDHAAGRAAVHGTLDGLAEGARDRGPVAGGEHAGGHHQAAIGDGDDAEGGEHLFDQLRGR